MFNPDGYTLTEEAQPPYESFLFTQLGEVVLTTVVTESQPAQALTTQQPAAPQPTTPSQLPTMPMPVPMPVVVPQVASTSNVNNSGFDTFSLPDAYSTPISGPVEPRSGVRILYLEMYQECLSKFSM